jgi:hypothetical protein
MKVIFRDIAAFEYEIYNKLLTQTKNIGWISKALDWAWESFKKDGWAYDGATFVREKNHQFWEVAAFIHDMLNEAGYVGRAVDLFFVEIMIALNYPAKEVRRRIVLMQFTFINVLWHKLRGTFKKNGLPEHLI